MANQKDIDLIFHMLKTASSKYPKHKTSYELGYLVGFLAMLMANDSAVKYAVIHGINKKLKKN